MSHEKPMAVVLGDMDLVRPLALAGVPCAVVASPGDPARYSRAVRHIIDPRPSGSQDLTGRLVDFAHRQPDKPVLFYQLDTDLLLVSRARERLGQAYRLLVEDPERVEDLVDKARFLQLADELSLPIPPTRILRPRLHGPPPDLDIGYPLIIKPLTRGDQRWLSVEPLRKAVSVDSPQRLRDLWARLAASGQDFLAQQLIPGREDQVESYHVYIAPTGEIVGEFTGRKIRTRPAQYGHTTALEITDAADVLALGRQVVGRLDLRGVAKLDFKRGPDRRLHLLEINPRFNLWHHAGALAGVNLPLLVWQDLTGRPRTAVGSARPGVTWCHPRDLQASREWGVSPGRWLTWAARCDATNSFSWDDPLPLVAGTAWHVGQSLLNRRRAVAFPGEAASEKAAAAPAESGSRSSAR